jgi:hypothetical protein
LTTLLRTLPSVLDSVVLITLLLVIYSTVGLLLFRNTDEGHEYFPNFSSAMVHMLVLLTTANYPDVMMPAYNASRPSVLFFVSFLLVGLFFCMNLVLARYVCRYVWIMCGSVGWLYSLWDFQCRFKCENTGLDHRWGSFSPRKHLLFACSSF